MKKIIILSSLILIIFLISGCVKTSIKSSMPSTTETSKEQEKEQSKFYNMNEEISVNELTYKVTKAESFTKMGTSMFEKTTEGRFIKVYIEIMNNGKETHTMFTPRFFIIDDQDRKYERLSDDMIYITDYLEFGAQLQPGLKKKGAIVFEVPKDQKQINLIITGDWLSVKSVQVQLSSIKEIGADTTQKEEQDKMMDEAMADAQKQMDELMEGLN